MYIMYMYIISGGGTGFIGRHLTSILKENGYKVMLVSRKAAPDRVTWVNIQTLPLIFAFFHGSEQYES